MGRIRINPKLPIILAALSLLSLLTAILSHRRGIPLCALPVGATRWVLGSGVLRVEHTFPSTPPPRWWPKFDARAVRAGTWFQLGDLTGPKPVGYADVHFGNLGLLFLGAFVATLLLLVRLRREASGSQGCWSGRIVLSVP